MKNRKNWSYYKPGDLLTRLRQGEEKPSQYDNPFISDALAMGEQILTASDLLSMREAIVENSSPLILEVGCYKGTTLTALASENPHCRFLGIDIKYKRVVLSRRKLNKAGIGLRVTVAIIDLIDCLEILPHRSLQGACIFYPDPWSKDRFAERRMFSAYTVELILSRLCDEGFLWIKTDHPKYLEQIKQALQPHSLTVSDAPPYPLKAVYYPSDFETLFKNQNKQRYSLCLVKKG